jgi:uroporphyrinogen-III synthase
VSVAQARPLMKVLVLRPEPGASRTAEALASLGHEAVLAPLSEIVPVNGGFVPLPPPGSPYRCVVAASANAFAMLDSESRDALYELPALVVGAQTAAAAEVAGLRPVELTYSTAAELAEALATSAPSGHLLYLAGRDRKPEIEAALEGHSFTLAEVYAANLVTALPIAARRALRAGTVDAVLHYSARSARAYVELAGQAGLAGAALAPPQLCLSSTIAEALAQAGATDLRIAAAPDEENLLAQLGGGEMR